MSKNEGGKVYEIYDLINNIIFLYMHHANNKPKECLVKYCFTFLLELYLIFVQIGSNKKRISLLVEVNSQQKIFAIDLLLPLFQEKLTNDLLLNYILKLYFGKISKISVKFRKITFTVNL